MTLKSVLWLTQGHWRSCAGPSPTFGGAVTSALQGVNFCTHLAHTYQRTEDEPFLIAGPSAWNSLPKQLRTSALSLDSFRHSLKTFLFTQTTHDRIRLFSDSGLYKFTFYILHLHWKWHHSTDCIRVPIPWRYLVSFARYSELPVENPEIFIPHLYLAGRGGGKPVGILRRCLMLI